MDMASEADGTDTMDISGSQIPGDSARTVRSRDPDFWRQARWIQERFPDAVLRDVEGLVKLADHDELAANDWSLTPGRYVGVAPEEEDENSDFAQTIRDIHLELDELNAESVRLAATIKRDFQESGL